MCISDLSVESTKEQKKRERIKVKQHMAAGMIVAAVLGVCVATGILLSTKAGKEIRQKMKGKAIDTVEKVKNIVEKSADRIEVSAAQFEEDVSASVDTAQRRAEGLKKGFCEGGAKITQDIKETTENMAKEFKE